MVYQSKKHHRVLLLTAVLLLSPYVRFSSAVGTYVTEFINQQHIHHHVRTRLPYIHDSTWSLHDMVLVLRTYVRILSDHFTSRSSCIVPCDRWFPGCLCTYVRTSGSGDHGKYASMPQRVLTYGRMYARSLHVRTYVHTFNERKGITCSYVRTSAPTLMRHRITRTCVRTYVRTYVRNYACAYCCRLC